MRRWTPDEVAYLRAAIADGHTIESCARLMNRSPRSVQHTARRSGLFFRRFETNVLKLRLSDQTLERLKALSRETNMMPTETARVLITASLRDRYLVDVIMLPSVFVDDAQAQ
jgi:hypothetical protein